MLPPDKQVGEYMQRVAGIVDEHGWMVQAVGSSDVEPAFCYTVGLARLRHPEFILCGLPFEVSAHLLNDLGERVRAGTVFSDGTVLDDLLKGYDVYLMEVTDARTHLSVANAFHGDTVKALQVVWPDADAHFPWDPGYPENYRVVPLLGVAP